MVGTRNRRANEANRIKQRTSQILDAAARVFARKGFHRSTTKEIAAEAGVAEGTIYNYYNSKQDLIIAMVAKLASESLFAIVARADTMDARTFLTELLRDRLTLFDRNREIAQVIISELMVDGDLRRRYFADVIAPLAQQMMAYYARRVEAGDFRRVDPRIVFPAMVGATFFTGLAITGELPLPSEAPALSSREEVIAELVDFFLHGIGTN
ncbi:MAG: TetR/AcrR family transcriptional regulator [Chloroflexi bacterium]|nr:TetR/AcrR family transcriptional regulator [Chloroflexota bacterium]